MCLGDDYALAAACDFIADDDVVCPRNHGLLTTDHEQWWWTKNCKDCVDIDGPSDDVPHETLSRCWREYFRQVGKLRMKGGG